MIGFNSAKYDLVLIRANLLKLLKDNGSMDDLYLLSDSCQYPEDLWSEVEQWDGVQYPELETELDDFEDISVIKQHGSYTSFNIGSRFSFIDLYKYCSPNTNLNDFMKTHGQGEVKGVFPYEYLTKDTLYSEEKYSKW